MHRVLLIGVFLVVIFGAYQLILSQNSVQNPDPIINIESSAPILTPKPTPTPTPTPKKVTPIDGILLQTVPFAAQAPFGEWSDPRQQDGCEEVSVLMAMHWVRGESIASKQAAKDEIIELSHYQEDNFGEYRDSSAEDTAERLIKGYYQYNNYEVKDVESADDIITELENGNLVIIPANGRVLGNPSFTAPGPERHMLLIKGYDSNTSQFITNEPGIRQGESYRYSKNVLFGAIRDYESGYHKPILESEKLMIVIKKS